MNYQLVYDSICERGKMRKKSDELALEKHHIIPVFLFKDNKRKTRYHKYKIYEGTGETRDNICYLTPREHFLAHVLLYQINKHDPNTVKAYAGAIMMFFRNNNGVLDRSGIVVKTSRMYEIMRKETSKIQSEKMKNKMNVRCVKSGSVIGIVPTDHPKIKTGEWVHVTKNRIVSESEREMRSDIGTGKGNNNYKDMTEERKSRLFDLVPLSSREINGELVFILKDLMDNMKIEFVEFKKISRVWLTNNFDSIENFIREYNNSRSLKVIYKKNGKGSGGWDTRRLNNND